jgi:hypothetical protein
MARNNQEILIGIAVLVIIGIVLIGGCVEEKTKVNQTQIKNLDITLSLFYDPSYYLRSTGGETKNGCEAWTTLLKTDEYIYAAKCDAKRLEELGFDIPVALNFNQKLPQPQQISKAENYYMVDYTDIKNQVLYGYTANKALAHIILNEKKEFIYYRIEGDISQFKETGMMIENFIKINDNLSDDEKIIIDNKILNIVKDIKNNKQIMIGNTFRDKTIALVIDEKGKYQGHILVNK